MEQLESWLEDLLEKQRIKERNEYWSEADGYYRDGNWDEALRYYQKALGKDPQNQAIKNNIRHARARQARDTGKMFYERGDWDKAIEYYEKANRLTPNDIGILEGLSLARAYKSHQVGKEYYARKDWDNAIKHFRRAREYHYDLFFSHAVMDAEGRKLNAIGQGYFKAEDWDGAVRHFRRASNKYPFLSYLRINLKAALGNKYYEIGGYHLHDGDWVLAIMYFERSLEYWPNDQEILRDLEKAKLGYGRQALRDRAKRDFLTGEKYFYRENWDAAIRYFEAAEKNDPGNRIITEKLKLAKKKKAELENLRRTTGQPLSPPVKDLEGTPVVTKILPFSKLVTRLTGGLTGFRPALTRREEKKWFRDAGPWLEAASTPFSYVNSQLLASWVLYDWATDPVSFGSDMFEHLFGTRSLPIIKRAKGLGLTNLQPAQLLKETRAAERLLNSQVPEDIKQLAREAGGREERYRELLYNDKRFSLYILGSVMQVLHERVRKVDADMRSRGKLRGWREFSQEDYEVMVSYAIEHNRGTMHKIETVILDLTIDYEKTLASKINIPMARRPWLD